VTTSDPRLAWDVIEDICISRFTGQVSLTTAIGTTNVYMTRGLIYLAEHTTEAPLGERIAAAGVIPDELLPADGTIGQGLGDLDAFFAGHPPSAREGAEEVVQVVTERTLLEISEQAVLAVESTMYRHHPSGVDRWFSSQHARGGAAGRACDTQIVIQPGDVVAQVPPPQMIPQMVRETISTDVADVVRRAVSAIEAATKTIGPAPEGFVRPQRGPTA
jgi:hypothetical protein